MERARGDVSRHFLSGTVAVSVLDEGRGADRAKVVLDVALYRLSDLAGIFGIQRQCLGLERLPFVHLLVGFLERLSLQRHALLCSEDGCRLLRVIDLLLDHRQLWPLHPSQLSLDLLGQLATTQRRLPLFWRHVRLLDRVGLLRQLLRCRALLCRTFGVFRGKAQPAPLRSNGV